VAAEERIVQVRKLADGDRFAAHLAQVGADIRFDRSVESGPESPLAQPITVPLGAGGSRTIGNRWAILPMEGWDATSDGRPTEHVIRRWNRFGASGAKLIWGGEAIAVCDEGRANPNQLRIGPDTIDDISNLRAGLVDEHRERFGTTDDFVVGLQLTHSGRYARPSGDLAPKIAYAHPWLDQRVKATQADIVTDDDLDHLHNLFVSAAEMAAAAGFDFVDVKSCHGYLLHELLSGVDRPGPYGGDFEGRTRFLRRTIEAIAKRLPNLGIGVRLSIFDLVPHSAGPDGTGAPERPGDYPYAFGGDGTGVGIDLTESDRLVGVLKDLGVGMVCVTAGSPYYCPHAQRPAYFPPSDGYQPPTDPLIDVARMINATGALKARHPDMVMVGTGYSYLQDWLPNVAQSEVRSNRVDLVGIGRMALSYHDLPADILEGTEIDRRRICRTFSDCTTGPRNGLVSGCFPLDDYYKAMPVRAELAKAKRAAESARRALDGTQPTLPIQDNVHLPAAEE
jgi:2,4-dienoyl-CoA reductase-like NADH-dependent reductase (Old Yellow Enzyme family)